MPIRKLPIPSWFQDLLPWVPPALLAVRLKQVWLEKGCNFLSVRLGKAACGEITYVETLSFFRNDLLICFILIPCGLLLMTRWLPPLLRATIIGLSSVLCLVFLYIELHCLYSVGRFLSLSILLKGFDFAWKEGGILATYARPSGLAKTGLLIAFMTGVSWWNARRQPQQVPAERYSRWITMIVLLSVGLTWAVLWLPRIPTTSYHASAILVSLNIFAGRPAVGKVDDSEFRNLSAGELIERYNQFVRAPVPMNSPYFASAKGSDVIFFVFETGSAKSLPADYPWNEFPNLRSLRENSFVGMRHETTYPYTSRALFSIFSSRYPSNVDASDAEIHPNAKFEGMMHPLTAAGYNTAVFSPSNWNREPDDAMFKGLGFQQLHFADEKDEADSAGPVSRESAWQARLRTDLATLALLKQHIDAWASRGQRYAVAFLPQIGHRPWPDISKGGEEKDFVKRGRAIMALQDAWLGEIMKTLDKHGRLRDTVIVVTGDHGVRTKQEEPSFVVGMVDESSFHVPLLIYTPRTLPSEERIPWITSHIDIGPTILNLLGESGKRECNEGAVIWDPKIQDRTTYFFAAFNLGVDGYHSGGRFFMRNQMGGVYQSTQLHFDDRNAVPYSSPLQQEVARSITRMVALQQALSSACSTPQP